MRWLVCLIAAFVLQGCVRYDARVPDSGMDDDGGTVGQDPAPWPDDGDSVWPTDDGDRPAADAFADGGYDGGPSIYPACEQRGGRCTWVDDLDAACPDGSFSPFSDYARLCPTDSIQICCVPTGGFGSPCTLAAPCDSGGCLPQSSGYPPGGFCSAICDPGLAPTGCPVWATCLTVFFSQAMGMCLPACRADHDCRVGWSCQAFPTTPWEPAQGSSYVCWEAGSNMGGAGLGQACSADDDCLSGLCVTSPDGAVRCAAACDDAHPCLDGYACRPVQGLQACLPW